jgi:iron-sulfur cluster repair protein YtfE (RIC family)
MLDGSMTVNEVIARWPQSIATLNALGIDSCCGGAETLREVASALGMAESTLITALVPALGAVR